MKRKIIITHKVGFTKLVGIVEENPKYSNYKYLSSDWYGVHSI